MNKDYKIIKEAITILQMFQKIAAFVPEDDKGILSKAAHNFGNHFVMKTMTKENISITEAVRMVKRADIPYPLIGTLGTVLYMVHKYGIPVDIEEYFKEE